MFMSGIRPRMTSVPVEPEMRYAKKMENRLEDVAPVDVPADVDGVELNAVALDAVALNAVELNAVELAVGATVTRTDPEDGGKLPSADVSVDGEGSSRGHGPDDVVDTARPDGASMETVDGDASDEAGSAPNVAEAGIVDGMGEAVGVTFEAGEELDFLDKVESRDQHRWELDPESDETPATEPEAL